MLVQNLLGLFKRCSNGNGDEVLLGHHVADGNIGARLEAKVAVGEDAYEPLALSDGHAGDFVAAHDLERVGD